MVLHLDEYTEKEKAKGNVLNHYDKLPKYLHEMEVEDIIVEVKRRGTRSVYVQQLAISDYFSWLTENYKIDLAEKNYMLKMFINKSKNDYQDILNIEQLKRSIEENLILAESGNTNTLPDYSGLKAIFFLEWYGVLPKSAVAIKLTDVSDDGKQVIISTESRTILIDDEDVARYFSEYKQKTGFKRSAKSDKETPYPQDTFYRNTGSRNTAINEKTIYNIRQKFISGCGDKRFSGDKVYLSGRYNEMLKEEYKYSEEFSASDKEACKIISKIFNDDLSYSQITSKLRDYRKYKETYLRRI